MILGHFHRSFNWQYVSGSEFLIRPRPKIVQSLTADNLLIIEAVRFKF